MENAKEKGKERKEVDVEKFIELWNKGVSVREIAKLFGVSCSHVCRLRKRLGLPRRRQALKHESIAQILEKIQEEGGYCDVKKFSEKARRLIRDLVEKRQLYEVSFRGKWCGRRLRKLIKPEYARKTFICSSREAVIKLVSSAFEEPKSREEAKSIAFFLKKKLGLTDEEVRLTPFVKKRRSFAARADLLERLSEIAKVRGQALTTIVNELFEKALKVDSVGLNVVDLPEEGPVLSSAREAGFTLALKSLWHGVMELAYERAREEASKMWLEAGAQVAKKYTVEGRGDPLSAFKEGIEKFMLRTAEFNVKRGGGLVEIEVVDPSLSEPYAFFMSRFFEGALEVFGYKVVESKFMRGFMRLLAVAGSK
jgi:predicted transcriptional regulator